MSVTKALPEQGQLVKVRQRQYVVTAVRQTMLPTSPLLPQATPPQSLVLLSSIEDDGLGRATGDLGARAWDAGL